jgi:hypothetical protein
MCVYMALEIGKVGLVHLWLEFSSLHQICRTQLLTVLRPSHRQTAAMRAQDIYIFVGWCIWCSPIPTDISTINHHIP